LKYIKDLIFEMSLIENNHKKTRNYHIKSVLKALRIIERLAESPTNLKTLEQELSLGKTTVYRFISTLKSFELVRQEPSTGLFGLGYKIVELSKKLEEQFPLLAVGHDYMLELHYLYDESVNLAVLEGTEILYVKFMESSKPLRMGARLGDRLPANCTALGKVLLSAKRNSELLMLYNHGQGLVKMTPNSITDFGEFKRELQKVRASGVAIDQEESIGGIKCVAGPIRDYNGTIIAAMSIAVPTHRAEEGKLEQFTRSLQEITKRFSQDLGYQE
jgi:IclR family acetate operon transcriptional repressor